MFVKSVKLVQQQCTEVVVDYSHTVAGGQHGETQRTARGIPG